MKIKFENPFKVIEREDNFLLAICTVGLIVLFGATIFALVASFPILLPIPILSVLFYVLYKTISIK